MNHLTLRVFPKRKNCRESLKLLELNSSNQPTTHKNVLLGMLKSRIKPALRLFKYFTWFREFVHNIKSQFSYFPLVWKFCSRQSNNSISKLQERTLRIINGDQKSNLLRNLHTLMIELYKIINKLLRRLKTFFFYFVKLYMISKTFRFYQTAKRNSKIRSWNSVI